MKFLPSSRIRMSCIECWSISMLIVVRALSKLRAEARCAVVAENHTVRKEPVEPDMVQSVLHNMLAAAEFLALHPEISDILCHGR